MTQVQNNLSYGHLHGAVDGAQPTDLPGNGVAGLPTNGNQIAENSSTAELSEQKQEGGSEEASSPSVDIFINNVVCTFSVRCHLNLQRIGLKGRNVEYRRDAENAKLSARRCARALQKLGFRVCFSNYKVVNVLGTCAMPWGIRIPNFSREHPRDASYEPELHPAVTYRIKSPKATLKIFSTGSITCTAPSVENVQLAIQNIYPLVLPFKKEFSEEQLAMREKMSKNFSKQKSRGRKAAAEEEELEEGEVMWDDVDDEDDEEDIEEDMYSGSDDSDF